MKPPKLVRYVSPFGSPAWMTRERAVVHLMQDDAHWENIAAAERETGERLFSEEQRRVGPPRIEHQA